MPIAYFVTHLLSAAALCQIIKETIKTIRDAGAIVHGSVFDGALKNLGMDNKLGYQIERLDGSLPHPVIVGEEIYNIFDICYMIN